MPRPKQQPRRKTSQAEQLTLISDTLMHIIDVLLKIRLDQDEGMARIVEAIKPGSYDPCDRCGRYSLRPFRNSYDHGLDFCSEECQDEYIEDHDDERSDEAMEIAQAKMEKYPEWDDLWERVATDSHASYKGIEIINCAIMITPSEEEKGVTLGTDGEEIVISWKTEDGSHLLSCRCEAHNHTFEVKAEDFFANPTCPECITTPTQD